MANGGLAEAKWEQGDSSWRVIGTEIDVDGSREPFEAHLTPVDPSQLIFRNAAGEVVFRRTDRFPPLSPGPLEPGPNYRHLQHLGKTTGKLVCAGTRADGKQITGTALNRWVLNQNFMLCTEQGVVEGEDPTVYLIMIGWHPAEKKCAMWGAGSDGLLLMRLGDYDAGERVWAAEQVVVTADGKTGSGTAKEHYPEEGGLTLELTGFQANGEPIPDVKAEYRNATPTPAAERLKDWEYFIGDWEVDGVWQLPHEEPRHVRYQLSVAWTLDGNFIENRTVRVGEEEPRLVHQSLVGIDPQTDQITAWGFWARFGGYQETVVWSQQDDKTWIVTRENLRGVRTIVDADTYKYEAHFRMDDGSPGKWQTTAKRKK